MTLPDGPDETTEPDRDADDELGDDAGRDDLLSTAEELGRNDAPGWRGRASTVRRPRRVVRGAPSSGRLDDATEPEQVRVRSTAEEGPATHQPSQPPPSPDEPEGGLLDASGQVIERGIAGPRDADEAAGPVAAPQGTPPPPQVLDASVFLFDAVRGYLDAVDEHGVDAPITVDRRARLRRTLELWDRQTR